MQITVNKSEIKGTVQVPSSKSQTIRGLMCAALTRGESEIVNPLESEDTSAAVSVLQQVGIYVKPEDGLLRVAGLSFKPPEKDLYCGESATTLRFMTAICSLIPAKCRLTGGPSLSQRPVKSLVEALKKLRVKCSIEGKTTPPVNVEGGALKGGVTELPGNISSQFISALLLIAPLSEKGVSIRLTTALTSRPYVLMTLRCLRKFGISVHTDFDKFVVARQRYQPTRFEIEGDWSSASYLLALGAAAGEVAVENLSTSSLQGDRVILDYLRNMGAPVKITGKAITVGRADLKAIRADLTDSIDLLPTMAILAALAEGTSEFTGIERARIKESNRVAAVREGLQKLGVAVTEEKDRLTVTGLAKAAPDEDEEEEADAEGKEQAPETPPENVVLDCKNDHRLAMAFSIFGAANGGVTIADAECVAKTYPAYWDVLQSLGGQVTKNE